MSGYEELIRLVTFRPLERRVPSGGRISPFSASWSSAVTLLAKELRALGARRAVGVTKRGEQYAGWKQLESGGPSADRGRELIAEHGGVVQALKATHPDHGGDAAAFADVQAARGVS